MTRPFPFLTEAQWHQGQSPRLCPLCLQGQSTFPCSLSWQSFTMSRALHSGVWLLRCLRPPSHTLAFLRPLMKQGGVGVPQFRDIRRIEIPVAACYRPGAIGTTPEGNPHPSSHAPSLLGQVCQPFSPVGVHDPSHAGFSRQHRNQGWSVTHDMASRCRTFVPGLPTPTSATRERRPGSPYTVVHV